MIFKIMPSTLQATACRQRKKKHDEVSVRVFICLCFCCVQFLLSLLHSVVCFPTLKLEQTRRIDWMYENISFTTTAAAAAATPSRTHSYPNSVRLFNALNLLRAVK